MSIAEVSYARRGPLAVIRLERPEALNALTYPMIAEVERLARQAEADTDVAAICITGAGRGFCAGLDMTVLAATAEAGGLPVSGAGERSRPMLFSFLLDISKPVIAAMNGVGAGGGFVLAMMCDLRFVAEDASLITVFSKRGLIAEHGTSWLLPRMIGLSRALDLLWSSRRVDAQEAYRLGLADRIFPAETLLDEVEAYVATLAATVSPTSLAVMKSAVHRHLAMSFDEAAVNTQALMATSLAHTDATEGAAHFIEKRAPKFAPWIKEPTDG